MKFILRQNKINTLAIAILLVACTSKENQFPDLFSEISTMSSIDGKTQYLASPFVTAGNRVYLIGHQDGSFPDLGWHVTGEMGGLWDHPIKLMDGFSVSLKVKESGSHLCLDHAEKFINYPVANLHLFSWPEENIEVKRIQFIPDNLEGAVVEFRIKNKSTDSKSVIFSFTGHTDLRPTWLGERTNMNDGEDEVTYNKEHLAVVAKDKNNPWYVMFGSALEATYGEDKPMCETMRKGSGKDATLSYSLFIKPNEEIVLPVFMAGSYQSEDSLLVTYKELKSSAQRKLNEKILRYNTIHARSHLRIEDKNIEQMFEWLKYNTDWLTRNVPEQGSGLSAGLPDYPWWFGADATYALQGVLATGDHELAKNTILLLHKLSQKTNNNGRIIHEASTNGAVYNPGNVNETAQFVTLINHYYNWTGDKELVKMIYPEIEKGINWLLKERDPDGNGYPNGSGMMEIPGLESELEMIDVAVYTQQALQSASELAKVVGEADATSKYMAMADALKVKINKEWWNAVENSFGDFRGTSEEAAPIIEAALVRSDTLGKTEAVLELKKLQNQLTKNSNTMMPHVVYHNWVVNTPVETGIADKEKALIALRTATHYENAFGAFVTGIDKTQEPDSVVLKSRKKIFSYTGAVMTLPTSVLAIGSARYQKPDEALAYINKLHQSFSYALPGSMYEVSPDFGMITQAWNLYGVAVPIVNYFFGINPKAGDKSITITPNLPASWKNVSLNNVRVGDNSLEMEIKKETGFNTFQIQQKEEDWIINFDVTGAARIILNGTEIDTRSIQNNLLSLKGKENNIQLYAE